MASILIVAIERSSSWVSRRVGSVQKGLRLPAEGAGVRLEDALAAEPVPRFGASTAEVVSAKLGLVLRVPWHIRPGWIGGPSRGHTEDSVNSGLGPVGSGARAA